MSPNRQRPLESVQMMLWWSLSPSKGQFFLDLATQESQLLMVVWILQRRNSKLYALSVRYTSRRDWGINGQVEVSNWAIKVILEKTVAHSRNWSNKLHDVLQAYRTTYKPRIGTTPFLLVHRKFCHLSIELEHRASWEIKYLNTDLKAQGKRWLLQLNELEELRLDVYESSQVYKEKIKKWHDKSISRREFQEGDLVLSFNF